MVFRHFRLQVVIRVLCLVATMALFSYLISRTSLYATMSLVGLILIYQVWSLVHFVDRTNRQLTRFFDAVRHADFSQSFTTLGLGRSFEGLSSAFSEVADQFRRTRAEKEEQYRYLQTLVQHVGVGVIAFREDGEVELINQAAKRLLAVNHLKNISQLAQIEPELPNTLQKLDAGQRILIKVTIDYDLLQLAVHATQIRREGQMLTLVSIQNIGSELAEQEMVAWQNLIRVLTHEIMNSVTPIASLAGSVNDLVRQQADPEKTGSGKAMDPELYADLSGALTTIEKRSQGLLHFVEAYRNLTRIPRPDFGFIAASELIARVVTLLQQQAEEQRVEITTEIDPPEMELAIDANLIEQVLINLIVNSLQALKEIERGKIIIRARLGRSGRTLIEVIDNGPGIVDGALDKVFIPFFTTKKGGTGIGLALARQIMRLHGGHISVRSTPDVETCFTLSF
ncbi:MAG: ATP-binding protein [bacterium]|nr:ATP-binding protein [bacterium]